MHSEVCFNSIINNGTLVPSGSSLIHSPPQKPNNFPYSLSSSYAIKAMKIIATTKVKLVKHCLDIILNKCIKRQHLSAIFRIV